MPDQQELLQRVLGHRAPDPNAEALATLRAIVDAGGPSTPVVSGVRPPVMSASPRKPTLAPEGGEILGRAKTIMDLLNATPMGLLGDVSAPLENIDAAGPVAGVKKGIKAFHGSPHDFDKFSLSKIGTGEGAQAYGHGLYFADSEDVAKSYKTALEAQHAIDNKPLIRASEIKEDPKAMNAVQDLWNYIDLAKKGDKTNAAFIAKRLDAATGSSPEMRGVIDSWNRVKANDPSAIKPGGGKMYEVNINADPDDFLDWDAPLSQQPKVSQKLGLPQRPSDDEIDSLIARLRAEVGPERLAQHPEFKAMEARLDATRDMELPGESAYRDWQRPGTDAGRESFRRGGISSGPEAATSYLRNRGIPGIKYLDGASRSAGQGSRNYVVFDDSLIDILKKYGLAGAISGGFLQQAALQQALGKER